MTERTGDPPSNALGGRRMSTILKSNQYIPSGSQGHPVLGLNLGAQTCEAGVLSLELSPGPPEGNLF